MTEAHLNQLTRLILFGMIAGTLVFLVAAARPVPRYSGSYLAPVNTREAIFNDLNEAAAFVTINDPAVVSFPTDWQLADQVCMALRYERGTAPTALPFDDDLAQARWDDRPSEALLITTGDVSARTPDSTLLQVAPPTVYSLIEMRLPFRVRGFDQTPILLRKDQVAARLLCYNFTGGGGVRIPFVHVIRLGVQNAHVVHAPAFFFRFNIEPQASDPAEAFTLQKQSIESYLSQLQRDGLPVVESMTPAQRTQRMGEAAAFATPQSTPFTKN